MHQARRHFTDAIGEDATVLKKTRHVTDANFHVFLSVTPRLQVSFTVQCADTHSGTMAGEGEELQNIAVLSF